MNNNKTAAYYIVKYLILGDSAVGKTCVLLRFADNGFTDHHMPTIGTKNFSSVLMRLKV